MKWDAEHEKPPLMVAPKIAAPAERRYPLFAGFSVGLRRLRQMTETPETTPSAARDEPSRRLPLVLAIALITIAIGGAFDLYMDDVQQWFSLHAIFELLMIAGSLVTVT